MRGHGSNKDFWDEVTALFGKDGNLTKAHVLYLEARILQELKAAGQCSFHNSQFPDPPKLPESDQADMEWFLESIKLIMGVSGFSLFTKASDAHPTDDRQVFEYAVKHLGGRLMITDKGFLLLKGARCSSVSSKSARPAVKAMRDRMLKDGLVRKVGDHLELDRDHLFRSPSGAAELIAGHSIRGPKAWRLPDGTTLGQVLDPDTE